MSSVVNLIIYLNIVFVYCYEESQENDMITELISRITRLERIAKVREDQQDNRIRELQEELQREKQLRRETEKRIESQILEQTRFAHDQQYQFRILNDLVNDLKRSKGNSDTSASERNNKRQFQETVAFHSTLESNSALEHITVGSTIPFPNVKLNIGGGYDSGSSIFTAPMAGIYIFSTSITSFWNDKGELQVGIMKNGVYMAGAYVDDIGGPPEQGSVTIPLVLKVGDRVWIQHVEHNDGALYGGGLTSFMGCLIVPS